MGKRLEKETIKESEITLEKLNVQETIANKIKKLIMSEDYMYHILKHRRCCP